MTAFLCQYDRNNQTLTFVNAGHNPPLVFHKERGSISFLNPTGAAIGLSENNEISFNTVSLSAGDILLFYTDGVTEAINFQNEPFGKERLGDLILRNADLSAQGLVHTIRESLNEFIAGKQLEDDITLLACKIAALS